MNENDQALTYSFNILSKLKHSMKRKKISNRVLYNLLETSTTVQKAFYKLIKLSFI